MNYAGAVPSCPINDNHIKIYLIVQGSSNLAQLVLCGLSVCVSMRDKDYILSTCLCCCNLIFMLFLIGWTIIGSLWVWNSLDYDSRCSDAIFISAIICLSLHYAVIMLVCRCCTRILCHIMCNCEKYEVLE